MSILLRACAVLILAVAGIPTHTSATARPTLSTSDIRILRAASLSLGHHGKAAVLHWLREQAAVSMARLGLDRQTVAIHFRDGGQAAILPRAMTDVPIRLQHFHQHVRLAARSHAPGERALVMEPFAQEQLGPSAGLAQIRDLEAAGFQVDRLYNAQVTVNSMSTLSDYRIVYIHTHGGVNDAGEAVIETGQQVNPDDHSLDPLIQNFSVFTTGIQGSDKIYYGIMSRYILNYMGQFPANSMVFVNTCSLLKAWLFWKALQIKGVSTLVSYDSEPILPDALYQGDRFFDTMAQGMSVSETVALAQAQHWDTSKSETYEAHLGYVGDGLVTFQGRSSNPLVATPFPMPRPDIAPPPPPGPAAAPTAVPTSTPLPPPPLDVTLKSKVSPGAEQEVDVHSAPNADVKIQVSYPNGQQEPADERTTDGDGLATYAFVQQSSKIAPQRYTAQVAVTATTGGATASVSKSYKIGFAKVDIAVAPFVPSAGKSISIWVHAKARTRVTVSLEMANVKLGKFRTVTRGNGWGLVTYASKTQGSFPSHQPIIIHASVQNGRTTYKTQATFMTP